MPGSSQGTSDAAPSCRRRIRWRLLGLVAAFALAAGIGVAAWRPSQPQRYAAIHTVHVRGLHPSDGALDIDALDGLPRSPVAGDPVRVQAFSGFTVTGPDRFLTGGHPGPQGQWPAVAVAGRLLSSAAGGQTGTVPGRA